MATEDERVPHTSGQRDGKISVDLGRQLLFAIAAGAVGAFGALVFVGLLAASVDLLWADEVLGTRAFSGPVRIVVVMTVAGLVVGLIRRLDRRADRLDVFAALGGAPFEARSLPGGVLIGLVTLAGGFSLGPEVPTGMAAAGLARAWARRTGASDDTRRLSVQMAITGAFSGLFTAPFIGVLANVELAVGRRVLLWSMLVMDAAAAVAGFAVFYGITASWSETIHLVELPRYELELWHLGVAAAVGVGGAIVGLGFGMLVRLVARTAAPVAHLPVLRCGLAGLALGLLGMALPLTPFHGTAELRTVTEHVGELGIGLLAITAVAKLLATASALSLGFIGGPIFPLFFVGGTLGVILHEVAGGIPLALAVATGMAAATASVVPLPIGLTVLVGVIAGVPVTQITPVLVAAIVAFSASRTVRATPHG